MVSLLREQAHGWTYEHLATLVWANTPAPSLTEHLAQAALRHPSLWNVSDDELIAAVRDIDRRAADVLATPAGLNWLHAMSRQIAVAGGLRALFGRE